MALNLPYYKNESSLFSNPSLLGGRPYWIDVQTNSNNLLNFHLRGGGGSFKKLGNCKSPTGVILFKVKHFYKIKLNPFLHTLS